MLDYLRSLLDAESLSPHGICLLWRPDLIWTHVVSDAVIGVAYFSIPIALAHFVTRRQDLAFGWMFWCFIAFIMACGTTHFLGIWTLWVPAYGVEAVIKLITAAISITTAIMLWPLIPKALALPSPAALRAANAELAARVAERDAALRALEEATAERLKAEDMLRQAQKMEAVGQLTGGIAHDFNNLLTAVLANLDRIERHPGEPETVRRAAAGAAAGVERAAALVQQLLAFARRQPLDPKPADVRQAVGELASLLERTLEGRIELRIEAEGPPARATVDVNQLVNALLNLAVNARDAMPEGGTLTLRTGSERVGNGNPELAPGDYVTIEVADSGAGMPAEVARRAFEPFFTTKEVGKGSGLGLSQVWGFVKQSRGHVTLDSRPGEGTRIRIYLPATSASRAGREEVRAAWRPGSLGGEFAPA